MAAPFDLNEVISECSATTSSTIEAQGLQFGTAIDADVWPYWIGDAEQVQRVLLNLVGNAAKCTARGKIGVRVRSESLVQGERGLRFEVAACGDPAETTNAILVAFREAERTMSQPHEGPGVSLSMAHTLVEAMSGKVWVEETEEPEGSGAKFVFTIAFPLARKEELSERPGAALSSKELEVVPGTRILVVEDNPENMVLLRAYMDHLSLSLNFASNGVEALRKRQRGNYDLVLMDIQMPIMDGYTAAREIRAWERAHSMPRIPIVALTAHERSGSSAASIEAGCDWHLTKPVERGELVATIAKFANRLGGRSESIDEPIAARRPGFLANRKVDLAKMKEALAGTDFATLQIIGRNCKGIGSGYGFPEISTIGAAIETAAQGLNKVEVDKCIRELERCLLASVSVTSESPVGAISSDAFGQIPDERSRRGPRGDGIRRH
jgi:CheY-like chemotaxis protein